MKFNYKAMQGRATALLERFSEKQVTIGREIAPAEMVNGEAVVSGKTALLITAVASPIDKNLINGTTFQDGDYIATITHEIEPLMSDEYLLNGDTYEVVRIEKFQPSETVLAYKVQLRA